MRNKKKRHTGGDTEAIPMHHFCERRKDEKERKTKERKETPQREKSQKHTVTGIPQDEEKHKFETDKRRVTDISK